MAPSRKKEMAADSQGQPVARSPERRRGALLINAIHKATTEELKENGFDGVTFDRIARRAQMSRVSLYRRYRSPAHLVADTIAATAGRLVFETTGSFRADLLLIVNAAIEHFDRFGPGVYRKLIGFQDESIASLLGDRSVPAAFRLVNAAVEAAQARGELGPSAIPDTALGMPVEVLHSRLLLTDSRTGLAHDIVEHLTLPLFVALSRQ